MFNWTIMLLFMFLPILFLVIAFVLFKRKTMNLLMKFIPAWKKRYVVCHMNYQAGMKDIYNVIPNQSGLTQVGKYSYDLAEKYVALTYMKRNHYVLDEENAIPKNYEKYDKNEIIFQAAEIQTALDNNVMEYLFSKKKELLIIGLFIIATISMLALIYNIIALNELKGLMNAHISIVQEVAPKIP
jgi:hypothetical protein